MRLKIIETPEQVPKPPVTTLQIADRVILINGGKTPGTVVAIGPRGKVQVVFDDLPNRWILRQSSLQRVEFRTGEQSENAIRNR